MPGTDAGARALPLLLAALATLTPLSIDAYLVAFPDIGTSLHATPLQVQQSLTAFLLPFGVTMLFHGVISDAIGRRPVILAGLALYTVASAGAALAQSIEMLLACRAVQGLSAGVGFVVGRAIIRDRFHGPAAQRLMSQVTMLFAIAPALAPILGGWLHAVAGWHAIFWFLAAVGVFLALACHRFLPETLPPERRRPLHFASLLRAYAEVFTHREFLLLAAATTFNFAGLFLYVTSAPAFVMQHLGRGPTEFAVLFIPTVAGIVVGAFLSGRLAGRLSRSRTVMWAYGLLALAATANVALHALRPPGLPWSVAPLFFYCIGMSLAMPSITLLIIDLYPKTLGLVSSCQAFTQNMVAAAVAGLLSPALSHSALALACGMLACMLLGAASWALYLSGSGDNGSRSSPQLR